MTKKYANRSNEFIILDEALKHYDIVYIQANLASGITSFLNEYMRDSKCINIYINAEVDASIDQLLINYIIKYNYGYKLQEYANKHFGKKSEKLLNSIVQGIPYFGNTISYFADTKEAPSVYLGDYSSALSELLIPFFCELSYENKINIYFDSAQYISEQSFQIIGSLVNLDNIKLLFVFDNKGKIIKLYNYLSLSCSKKFFEFSFEEPNLKLIEELAQYYNLSLNKNDLLDILYRSNNNIHIINKELIGIKNKSSLHFDNIHKFILTILYISEFEISYLELYEIIGSMNIIFDLITLFPNSLKDLEKYSYVKNNNNYYSLITSHHPEINIHSDYANYMLCSNAIYSYYYKNINNLDLIHINLIYKLSKILNMNSQNEIAKVITIKNMEMGLPIDSLLFKSILFKSNKKDIYIQMLYYCREREYEKSLKYLKKLKNKKTQNILSLLEIEGILHNRLRNFSDAEDRLLSCLKLENNLSNKCIILSYLCVNYIHSYNDELAIKLYDSYIDKLKNVNNCGYLYRNISSAFAENTDKIDCFQKALQSFENFNDDFGIGTTLCNLGNFYCLNDELDEGLKHLLDSEMYLKKFGVEHLHIVYNDLGMCYLLLNKIPDAYKYLTTAHCLAKNNMPKIIISINLAYSLFFLGQEEKSIEILNQVEGIVKEHKLKHLQKKYFDNSLIIHFLLGDLIDYISYQSEIWIDKELLNNLQNELDNSLIDKYALFKKFYIKSGLVYWYIDPLKLL